MIEKMTTGNKRKLAVILAMDVVNYSSKMDNDEEGTLQKLKKCSEIIKSIISKMTAEYLILLVMHL